MKNIKLGDEKGITEEFGITYRYTWRSMEDFESIKLSPSMRSSLKTAIDNNSVIDNKDSIIKFQQLGICDDSGLLTKNGYVLALSLLNLDDQCETLNIPLNNASIKISKKPEFGALEYYKKNGYEGCFSHGGLIQIILYAACFDMLFPLHEKKYGNDKYNIIFDGKAITSAVSYSKQFMSFLGYFIELEDKLIKEITNSRIDIIKRNYDKILSFQPNESWLMLYKGYNITRDLVVDVFNYIGKNNLVRIAKLFFSDPYAYCKGWPDLTLSKDGKVYFVEVKTNDKLIRSEIITISELVKATDIDISVLKLY